MIALRTLAGLLRGRLGRPVPLAVTMALTYRCNLRCRYCQIWEEAGEELGTGQVLAAIDELVEAGACRLGLTGGEPLLRDDLARIVHHAKDRGLFTTVFTNGALVDRHLSALRRLDAVLVSLDGPRELHDAMRGQGSFDGALRAMELLARGGVPVWTHTVLTVHNIDALDLVLDTARRFGALAAFQPVFEHTGSVKGEPIDRLRPGPAQLEEAAARLLCEKRAGAPLLNSEPFLTQIGSPNGGGTRCLAGRLYGAVSPEGRLAPCPVLLRTEGLPDGTRIGFAEAFRRCADASDGCRGCTCIATTESDLLFSLDHRAVRNTLRIGVRQLTRRRPR